MRLQTFQRDALLRRHPLAVVARYSKASTARLPRIGTINDECAQVLLLSSGERAGVHRPLSLIDDVHIGEALPLSSFRGEGHRVRCSKSPKLNGSVARGESGIAVHGSWRASFRFFARIGTMNDECAKCFSLSSRERARAFAAPKRLRPRRRGEGRIDVRGSSKATGLIRARPEPRPTKIRAPRRIKDRAAGLRFETAGLV